MTNAHELDEMTMVHVFGLDSEQPEHMTYGQFLRNGNAVLLGPEEVLKRLEHKDQ